MWLSIIGAAIALVGLVLVFDARRIIKKNFPSGDENALVLGAKILGALVAIAGGLMCVVFL
ncbi:MAG: hypothetical protein IJ217_04130 [Clostridia bacterium]|nr:hypothetical protein [Clostridia bacterium]